MASEETSMHQSATGVGLGLHFFRERQGTLSSVGEGAKLQERRWRLSTPSKLLKGVGKRLWSTGGGLQRAQRPGGFTPPGTSEQPYTLGLLTKRGGDGKGAKRTGWVLIPSALRAAVWPVTYAAFGVRCLRASPSPASSYSTSFCITKVHASQKYLSSRQAGLTARPRARRRQRAAAAARAPHPGRAGGPPGRSPGCRAPTCAGRAMRSSRWQARPGPRRSARGAGRCTRHVRRRAHAWHACWPYGLVPAQREPARLCRQCAPPTALAHPPARQATS